jgi:hypothetical protein
MMSQKSDSNRIGIVLHSPRHQFEIYLLITKLGHESLIDLIFPPPK